MSTPKYIGPNCNPEHPDFDPYCCGCEACYRAVRGDRDPILAIPCFGYDLIYDNDVDINAQNRAMEADLD